MIYLISDHHFNHSAIIKSTNRPFKDVSEMNTHMIKMWNKIVSNKDTIYHLGDFSWGNREFVRSIVEQLNGYKILIKGNHDRKSKIFYHDVGFDSVVEGGVLLKNKFLLTHKPVSEYYIGNFHNIHGHIHNNCVENDKSYRYFNVCVEQLDYKPILFDEIIEKYEQ